MGSPGHLDVNIFKLGLPTLPKEHHVKITKDRLNFTYEDLRVNLKDGFITMDSYELVPEYIAIAFSVSLLHVLCVPRRASWKPGQPKNPSLSWRGEREIVMFPSAAMRLVHACGLYVATPSNHYLHHTYGQTFGAGGGRDLGAFDADFAGDYVVETGAGEGFAGVYGACVGCGGCGGCAACG